MYGRKLLFIEVGARWSTLSKEEASYLSTKCDENRARGLVCYTAVFQDEQEQSAGREDVDWWRATYSVKDAVVADPEFRWGGWFAPATAPQSIFVDPTTMMILEADLGFSPRYYDQVFEQYLK